MVRSMNSVEWAVFSNIWRKYKHYIVAFTSVGKELVLYSGFLIQYT